HPNSGARGGCALDAGERPVSAPAPSPRRSLLSPAARSGARRAKQAARVPGGQIWCAAAEATGSGRSARRGSRRWAGRRHTGLVKAGVRPGRDGPGRRAAGSSCRRRRPARGSATGEEQRWPELVELEEPGRARGRSSWIKQSGGDGDPALPRGRAAAGDGGDAALPLAVVLPPFGRDIGPPPHDSWCGGGAGLQGPCVRW
ncbi:unnamed protein product, partial [Urochloa humidicola]